MLSEHCGTIDAYADSRDRIATQLHHQFARYDNRPCSNIDEGKQGLVYRLVLLLQFMLPGTAGVLDTMPLLIRPIY